jgi:hypothetical protein
MLTQALTASTDMYKENSRILALLDDKAAKTAGLAGIFLGAGFAFLRKDTLADLFSVTGAVGFWLLATAIALLVLCIFVSGWVLWLQKLKTPPDPDKVLAACNLFLGEAGGPDDETRENHVRDQVNSWNRALKVQDRVIAAKSRRLNITQWLLLLTVISVGVLLVFLMIDAKGERDQNNQVGFRLIPIAKRRDNGKLQGARVPESGDIGKQLVRAASV